ncbi:hypothetical protein BXZ70DRAFT_1004649 [Cristinia sonorae]|uniref:BTB domain-containing protein n=1 Tax=Cristinia sonorae TaxID=1940300 RepID=A0A8K0XT11_9AGAR|nr:hypothetical protein BXZ70DRAFT_1004649 [Cristinia sonorae]
MESLEAACDNLTPSPLTVLASLKVNIAPAVIATTMSTSTVSYDLFHSYPGSPSSGASNTLANEPFDDEGADIIIRTADGTDFMVYKFILARASPFFKKMFSIPQPPGADEIPHLIPVAEDEKTIDTILRICYPDSNPPFDDTQAELVMEAGRKYDIGVVEAYFKAGVISLASSQPVKAYGLAYRGNLKEEAQAAAAFSLRFSLQELLVKEGSQFQHLPGMAIRGLVHYHIQCRDAAYKVVDDWSWITQDRRRDEDHGVPNRWWFQDDHSNLACRSSVLLPAVGRWVHVWLKKFTDDLKLSIAMPGTPLGQLDTCVAIMTAFLAGTASQCQVCREAAGAGVPQAHAALLNAIHNAQSKVKLDLTQMPL